MTDTPGPISTLADADLLLLVAELLAPPGAWSAPIEPRELASLCRRSAVTGGKGGLARRLRRTLAAAARTPEVETAAEHNRLFEGPCACPPNETAWVRRDKGAILADVAGFYRAFGFGLAEGPGEKHDHVVTELQFVALLMVAEAQATARGEAEHAAVSAAALASFLRDHAAEWVGPFASRLAGAARLPVHRALGATLEAFWAALLASRGIASPEAPAASPGGDHGSPYECGLCAEGATLRPGTDPPA